MKRGLYSGIKIFLVLVVLLAIHFLASGAGQSEHPRKIVVFKKWFGKEGDQYSLLEKHGAVKIKHLKLINGMAVHLPSKEEKDLRKK